MDGDIQPPIFVLYSNDGLVAFETRWEAEREVPPTHFEEIVGVWDATGRCLDHARHLLIRTELRAVPGSPDDGLFEVLWAALRRTGDVDVDSASNQELVDRAFWRFSLMDENTVRVGCAFKWIDAILKFVGYAPR